MVWQIYVLCVVLNCAAFKVSAPSSHLVAIRGQPTVLGCEFTSDANPRLSILVVTWQRQEDSRVVHSFYYGQDQLDQQSMDYQNRTALFVSELKGGNASLRMERVGPKDIGLYLCIVSNAIGTGRALVNLEYGVFYTEPRLSISVRQGVMVQFETEGFPKPEVQWVGAEGESLLHHTELTESADKAVGLYHLKSSYKTDSSPLNITFILKNRLLNQDLQRTVNLRYGDDETKSMSCSAILSLLCPLLVICLLIISLLCVVLMKRSCHNTTGNTRNEPPLSHYQLTDISPIRLLPSDVRDRCG